MFQSKTVFIVGAGASREFGLPTGSELLTEIAQLTALPVPVPGQGTVISPADETMRYALSDLVRQGQGGSTFDNLSVLNGCREISLNMHLAESIDNFLDQRQSDKAIGMVGKIAIALAIVKAEQASGLAGVLRNDFSAFSNGWLRQILIQLNRSCRAEKVMTIFENVSFICFNYDRCIEHYLYQALKVGYSLRDEQATAVMQQLEIIHPYGQIGNLPWQKAPRQASIEFGNLSNMADNIVDVARSIQTFSESQAGGQQSRAHDLIAKANQVVFLGFGFHEINMRYLAREDLSRAQMVYATAYAMSKFDIDKAREGIRGFLQAADHDDEFASDPEIHFFDTDVGCAEALQQIGKRLTG